MCSKFNRNDFRAHSSMDRVSACGAEDTSSIPVGRKTLKKPFLRREMAFSYTSSTCFFKQHKQQEQ